MGRQFIRALPRPLSALMFSNILETDENPVPGGNRAIWRWVEEPAEEA
jgi:hypothetical protein